MPNRTTAASVAPSLRPVRCVAARLSACLLCTCGRAMDRFDRLMLPRRDRAGRGGERPDPSFDTLPASVGVAAAASAGRDGARATAVVGARRAYGLGFPQNIDRECANGRG